MVRNFIAAVLVALCSMLSVPSGWAQIGPQTGADLKALQSRLQSRFQALPIANGVVLMPKFRTPVKSIEITDNAIAVDGASVTGNELRDKLGDDALLIFQLSYLDSESRRLVLGLTGATPPPVSQPAIENAPPSPPPSTNTRRARERDDIVRFGGSITVDEDETVTGDAVAIGGSATVNGQVQGEVVVIGGSLTLGPRAEVQGDVTVVGGSMRRDPGAVIHGKVSEIGVGDAIRRGNNQGMDPGRWWRDYSFNPFRGFVGTFIRVALVMLLAAIVLLVAHTPVQEIADRAAAEPFKSWAVGFLAEILFVPVLVLTVVVLAVSIIGIPLLLLIPVAIVAAMIVCLIGFTGVAYHIGRLVEQRFEQVRNRPYLATILGIVVIVSPLLLARMLGLIGLGLFASLLVAVGFVLEYVAWTTGLGAAALVRFGRPIATPAPPAAAVSVPTQS